MGCYLPGTFVFFSFVPRKWKGSHTYIKKFFVGWKDIISYFYISIHGFSQKGNQTDTYTIYTSISSCFWEESLERLRHSQVGVKEKSSSWRTSKAKPEAKIANFTDYVRQSWLRKLLLYTLQPKLFFVFIFRFPFQLDAFPLFIYHTVVIVL